jgi:transposase-like protein
MKWVYPLKTATEKTILTFIREKTAQESIIYSDGWRGYNCLVVLGHKNITKFGMVQMDFN